MKVTRISPGIYDVSHRGERFELERYPDGSWLLFQAAPEGVTTKCREYLNDFATKSAALDALTAR